jgi:toxin YoeB
VKVLFTPEALDHLACWTKTNAKLAKKIFELIEDCRRDAFGGLGKPEPLKHDYAGYWARRVNDEHRLIYRQIEHKGQLAIEIVSCRFHYSDR